MRVSPPVRPHFSRSLPGRGAAGRGHGGFTLLELMVASTIFLALLGLVFMVTSQTSKLWKSTNAKISTFQNARAAFDSLTRNLGQATLNHSLDYYDASWKRRDPLDPDFIQAAYGRWSDLHYISGPADSVFSAGAGERLTHAAFFQAPLGRVEDVDRYSESAGLMNVIGYHVEYADPATYEPRPEFLDEAAEPRKRFLLLQTVQAAERIAIYDQSTGGLPSRNWINHALDVQQTRVMAENIVALIILPMEKIGDTTLAPNYLYDSYPQTYDERRSHLLPPILQVTLVAIDEESASHLQKLRGASTPPLLAEGAFSNAASYEQDLEALKKTLSGENGGFRANYRVFTATIQTKERR